MAMDLARYFERIGFRGTPAASLEVLQELHALHPEAIPFENLSPFLGEAVKLDVASLEEKLVRGARGGWMQNQADQPEAYEVCDPCILSRCYRGG